MAPKHEESKTVRRCLDARGVSRDFVRPFWDKAVRFYRLWHGDPPDELQVTFSQVMLWLAHAHIADLLPKTLGTVYSHPPNLEAEHPDLEFSAEQAERWLHYQMNNRLRLFYHSIPTYQAMHIFGTGWRCVSSAEEMVEERVLEPKDMIMGTPSRYESVLKKKAKWVIKDQNIDYFQLLPAPNGGLVNPVDNQQETAMDYAIWTDSMTEDKIKELAKKGTFDKDAAAKLLETKPAEDEWENRYQYDLSEIRGETESRSISLMQVGEEGGRRKRYKVEKYFFRDKWIWLAEDQYILRDAPGDLPNNMLPIAKFVDQLDFENVYGIGTIETIEDLLLARILNFNARLDYMAGVFHPTAFVSSALMNHNPELGEDWGPRPYKTVKVPPNLDAAKAVYYDRFPDINPQTFMEESNMAKYMQEVSGSTGPGDYSQLAAETASGLIELVNMGAGRSIFRAQTVEYGGAHDEIRLILLNGEKYMNDPEWVRTASADTPWELIPPHAITSHYGIRLEGSRELASKQVALQQILALLPMLMQDPYVKDPVELRKQALKHFKAFDKVDQLFGEPGQAGPGGQPGGPGEGGPGGIAGMMNLGNRAGSVQQGGGGM